MTINSKNNVFYLAVMVVILSVGMTALTLAKSVEINYSWETSTIKIIATGRCSAKDGNSVQQNIILKSRIRENGFKDAYKKIVRLKVEDKFSIKDLMINTNLSPDQLKQWIAQNSHFDAIKFKSTKRAVSTVYINGGDLAKFIKPAHYSWLKKTAQEHKSGKLPKAAQAEPAAIAAEPSVTNPPGATPFKNQPQATPAPVPGEPVPLGVSAEEIKKMNAPVKNNQPVMKSEPNELTLISESPLSPNQSATLEERTKLATMSAFENAKLELTKELAGTPFMGAPTYSDWANANPEQAKINWNGYFSVERVKINDASTKVEILTKLNLKAAKADIKKSARKSAPVKPTPKPVSKPDTK